jgi:catechol 2,3-dioxygenase-like lactoylglutathione lyase family enzyme
VFSCVLLQPERDLSGTWLEKGTGISGARISGAHLRLPGCGNNGPTLEIFQYSENQRRPKTAANREGINHIAFEVDDIEQAVADVLNHGGSKLGDVTSSEVGGIGYLTFVYLADPEGNIIEIQEWK